MWHEPHLQYLWTLLLSSPSVASHLSKILLDRGLGTDAKANPECSPESVVANGNGALFPSCVLSFGYCAPARMKRGVFCRPPVSASP